MMNANPDRKRIQAASDAAAPSVTVPQPARIRQPLSLRTLPHKPAKDERSSDPYNTSGSFDRTKNWARVGKR
jgi:hypothetical protein